MTRSTPIIATILVFASLISHPLATAQSNQPSNPSPNLSQIRFILANPPIPDRGTPQTNRGTGTRGDCLYKPENPPLTILGGGQNLNLTISEHPTFWVYIPYTLKEAPSGEFSLQDGEDDVYRTRFQLPPTPGIVSITLPATEKPLQVGKSYRWYFEVNCPTFNSQSKPTPASVTGVVERVSSPVELQEELKTAKTPLERIAAYAKHSIWYEMLTELAQLHLNEPQNSAIKDIWVGILSDENISLKDIAQQPIAGAVSTKDKE